MENKSESSITSIDDLKQFYASVKYRILNPKTKQPMTEKEMWKSDADEQWKLLSIEQILQMQIGICYDTAMLTDHYLTKWNIEHLNVFAGSKKALVDKEDVNYTTHTFVVYKEKGLWYWLEGSWYSFKKNSFSSTSSNDLIKTVLKALANDNGVAMVAGEISSFPATGTSMEKFFDACHVGPLKYEVTPDASHSKETLDEMDLKEYGTQLLLEMNEGCIAFEEWVTSIQASHVFQTSPNEAIKKVAFTIAQENILTDTVSTIFKKIGQFISWFCQKIRELWNYFFGYTQRKLRQFNFSYLKIKQSKNNKFFNEEAFVLAKAPTGLIRFSYLNAVFQNGWYPDRFYDTFKTIMNLWENDPQALFDEFTVNFKAKLQAHAFYPLIAAGWGVADAKSVGDVLLKHYPAKGSMEDAGYYAEECELIFNSIDQINGSFQKVSTLFVGNGNLLVAAAKRAMDYSDRTDLTEHEAMQLADVVQKVSGFVKNAIDKYNKSYQFILDQGILLENEYLKFVK